MADGLAVLGVKHEVREDGIVISGSDIGGGEIDSQADHRIAMAFSMAALRATQNITVHDCKNVNTSFPGFVQLAQANGLKIQAS